MPPADYDRNVFINCPFDDGYRDLLVASIFTVQYCRFKPYCAFQYDDAATGRIEKIYDLIDECRLGIHDISRTRLTQRKLPRFNMPLELGIFFGAKRYGNGYNKKKLCVVFDTTKYRYKEFISDIGGQDITAHNNDIRQMITGIRNWLSTYVHGHRPAGLSHTIDGAGHIWKQYNLFQKSLNAYCKKFKLARGTMQYHDWTEAIDEFLKTL